MTLFDIVSGFLSIIGLLVVVVAVLIATGVVTGSIEITVERDHR